MHTRKENDFVGVFDMTNEEYHRRDGFSRSDLMTFKESPRKLLHSIENDDLVAETLPQKIGSALHTLILEPDSFDINYIVIPKVAKNTKAGKKLWADTEAIRGTRTILNQKEYDQIAEIKHSLESQFILKDLIRGATYEQSIFWVDEETQLLCKARPDIWHPHFVADLKSTVSVGFRQFNSSFWKYGYYMQCAMIREAILKVRGVEINDFVMIAFEKKKPYCAIPYIVDKEAIDFGEADFKLQLKRIKQCQQSQEWPAVWFPPEGQPLLNVPHYAKIEDEDSYE